MQTFGMFMGEGVNVRKSEDKQLYICNSPKTFMSFDFFEDDFILSYTSDNSSETFTERDMIFDGDRYVLNLGNEFSISVDEALHKIFFHKFLLDNSFAFSTTGASLIVEELVCGGLVNLYAENIGITGIISSSVGTIIGVEKAVENLGIIDSSQILMNSEELHNVGKITGKNISLNAESIELEEESLTVATDELKIKSRDVDLNKASIISKRADINVENFELESSVLNIANEFLFNGEEFRLKEQSEILIGSKAQICSKKFRNYNSRIEAENLSLELSLGEAFLNSEGEILAYENAYIKTTGEARNEKGQIEARKLFSLDCDFLNNSNESIIEGGKIKITSNNMINHKSIIRSLLGDTEFNLKMKGSEFVPNSYVHTNARNKLLKTPEDKFIGKRFSDIDNKFPKPEEKVAEEQSSKSDQDSTSEKEGDSKTDDKTKDEEKTDKKEIGSLLNYSGEIISAGELIINGSGSLYNLSDSIISSNSDMKLKFYGKLFNKNRSEIKTTGDIEALAKMGMIYFENSTVKSKNCRLKASESCFDEFSIFEGTGLLSAESERFINRGLLQYAGGTEIKYGWFDNSGKITSSSDIKVSAIKDYSKRSFTNKGGEIISDKNISIESINVKLGGKIKAREFIYKFYNSKLEGCTFFIDEDIICEKAIYDFGVTDLRINSNIDLTIPTVFLSGGFYNEGQIKAKAPLKIKSKMIQNGYEHNLSDNIERFNTYNLYNYEYDFKNKHDVSVTKDDHIYIHPEKFNCDAAILGEDTLIFEADDLFYNSGTIESKKKITLNGKKIQTGWASWNEKIIQLPFVEGAQNKYKCHDGVFDFPYDFFVPQRNIIRSYGDMEINCDKFISSFGNMQIGGSLEAKTDTLFLNYAGNIALGKNSHIETKEFVNTIGTMATNDEGFRYWKISAATTDPAMLLCDGILRIDASKYFKNRASYLSSVGDMFLNGQIATGLLNGIDSRFVNESVGTEYFRMYTISGVDVSHTSHSFCGFGTGSSTTITYWWQDINEIVKNNVIRAAITSAQNLAQRGFAGTINTGVIDAKSIQAKEIGELGFSHGDKSRLQFEAVPEFNKKLTIEQAVNKSDLFSDYLFTNSITDEIKIPFAIIDDGSFTTEELQKAEPAMTIPEYAQMMYREMLKNYSTSRLSDMPTFEDGAKLAEKNSHGNAIELPYFAKGATNIFTIKPEEVKSGIYFRPYKYIDKYYGKITLFPELYLSENSLHQILRDPYGAIRAEEDIEIETKGKFDATASMMSGGHTEIEAKSVNIETQTFDRHTITSQNFASASGNGLLGSKTTGTKTKWEILTASRSPVIITTRNGLGICLQEGETANLQGIIAHIGGGLKVTKGKFVLTPLMVNEISFNENGSYVIPEYLKSVLDVDGDTELEVDVFENTGSEIHTTGKLKIKANEVGQTVLAHEYLANEEYGASQSFFSSKVRHEKCYAQKVVMPVMTAADIDIQSKGKVNLEGLIISEKDIKIAARGDVSMASLAFYQLLDYSETAKGIFSNANVRRFFENPQIAPNIVRAGGDFILNTLENYYATGVQAEIVGRKTVNAKNIISKPLKVRKRDEIIADVTSLSLGLPSSVMNATFSMQFSEAGKQILSQHPMYQAIDNLLGARNSAHKASALVNVGLASYDTVRTVSEALEHTGGEFTAGTAKELMAKFFDIGGFGISHSHTHQALIMSYGIPSIDIVGGDLYYGAMERTEFTGHQAKATNTTIMAGKEIVVVPDVEEETETVNQHTTSMGYNIISGDSRFGYGGMNSKNSKEVHKPTTFVSSGINTFQAPHISMTNPLLQATENRFKGETKFTKIYDVNRSNSSTYNTGVALSSRYGFVPRINIGGGRSHSYIETNPLTGVVGDIEVEGSLTNNSVSVEGEIRGNYSYYYRAPINESRGWGVAFSGITLAEGLGESFTRAVKSGILGYGAGKIAQSAGLGDFTSSLIGSIASAYASNADSTNSNESETRDGFSSLGHITEVDNNHELDIELLGFNREQFNKEIESIKQSLFNSIVEEGNSTEIATKKVEQFAEEVKEGKARVDETAERIENNENNLREEVKSEIGEEEILKLAEGRSISEENKAKVVKSLNRSIKKLEKQRAELNLKAPSNRNEVQQASLQTQNELIEEKIHQYSILNELLSRDNEVGLRRSSSLDNLLEDTYIRQGQMALGTMAGAFTSLAHEANTLSRHDYVELQRTRLPEEAKNNPEVLAKLSTGYMLYKGVAKVGEGISALDDVTGNVVSGAMNKIGEGFEWLGTHTRRYVRDDLGFSQRVAQNTGDIAKLTAEIFAPATVFKTAGSISKVVGASKFRATLGEKFGLFKGEVSATKIGLDWNGTILGEQSYGMAFENYVATLPEFRDIRLPKNFKTFDFWEERKGRAISVKTLNTNTTARLLNPESIYHTLKRYVDKTVEFTEYGKGLEKPIASTDILSKEIQLGIPADTGLAQMQQIQRAVDYGKLHNVKVVITRIGK